MKFPVHSVRLICSCAAAVGTLTLVGCQTADPDPFGTANRRAIEPAPTGLPTSGIGAPGGASEDTRAVGSVAASEGQATSTAPSAGIGTTSSPHR